MYQPPSNCKTIKKHRLRLLARRRFVDNVSVSGLTELYYAPTSLVRFFWAVALAAVLWFLIAHILVLIQNYLNQEPGYDFFQTDKEKIPFPKVTACAPTGLNKTWWLQRLRFPPREQKLLQGFDHKRREEFEETTIALLMNGIEYILQHNFSPKHSRDYFAYVHVVTETLKNIGNLSRVSQSGSLPSCDRIVSNCRINEKPYDCCEGAVSLVDQDGVCYDLKVDKLHPSMYQPARPTSPISFTFDLVMDWDHIISYNTMNGFYIHLNDPFTVFGKPVAVPAGMHATIEMSQPMLRKDESDCFVSRQLDTLWGPYDSEGYLCKEEKYMREITLKYMNCSYAEGGYIPNESTICTGSHNIALKMFATYGAMDNDPVMLKVERSHQIDVGGVFHSKTRCLPLCKSWEYTSRPSYSELLRDDYSTADGYGPENTSRSRVTVTVSSDYYLERTEMKLKPAYKLFLEIADVMGLFIGASVISAAEIVFYTLELCRVYRKTGQKTSVIFPDVPRFTVTNHRPFR